MTRWSMTSMKTKVLHCRAGFQWNVLNTSSFASLSHHVNSFLICLGHMLVQLDIRKDAIQCNISHQLQSAHLPTNLEGHMYMCVTSSCPLFQPKKNANGKWRSSECSRSIQSLYKTAFPASPQREKRRN